MPLNSADECKKVEEALRKAAMVSEENTINVLKYQLEERYNVKIGSPPRASLDEIEKALFDIAGDGADLFISRMRSFMRQKDRSITRKLTASRAILELNITHYQPKTTSQ